MNLHLKRDYHNVVPFLVYVVNGRKIGGIKASGYDKEGEYKWRRRFTDSQSV